MTRAAAITVRCHNGSIHPVSDRSPAGFTLVELLVSLVILSVLASLALSGMSIARTRAKAARSATTIRKLSEILLPYYEQYDTRRPSIPATTVSALLSQPDGRALYASAKRLALRRLMTLELPERVADLNINPATGAVGGLPWNGPVGSVNIALGEVPPVARRYQAIISGGGSAVANWDSAELLHMIITRGPAADPDVISHFRDDESADTDGDGLPEFVDGWRRPIRFLRWPIGFASPMQPIDGTLSNVESTISSDGHRLIPLVFSAGFDGVPDVDEMPALSYAAINFDPFAFNRSTNQSLTADASHPAVSAVAGSVVLVPVRRVGDGPVTFVACRVTSTGVWTVPSIANCTTVPDAAFQTVGSKTGPGAADNVTNHDTTR